MIDQGINTPLASSCGRWFDALSALLDLCPEVSYEGQAAIELEMIAAAGSGTGQPDYPVDIESAGGHQVVRLDGLVRAVVDDLIIGRPPGEISAGFHAAMAQVIVRMAGRMKKDTGLDTVALSGGCFQNRVLLNLAVDGLAAAGFQVLTHRRVPCNDGAVSLGQAVVAGMGKV